MNIFKICAATLALIMAALSLPGIAAAAPAADLWPYWEKQAADNSADIDHSAWTRFLERHTRVEDGKRLRRLRYAAVDGEARDALRAYLRSLQQVEITRYSRPAQLAFWLNLYNAATVDLVLENYPVDSIRKIHGGLFNSGPWDRKILEVEGKALSLNDIEHRILRPIWKTPLIHYGVNCASVGCPNLPEQAFTADNSRSLLEDNARDYINSVRGAAVEDGELTVSSIYKWFRSDFGGSEAGVLRHLRQYADGALKTALADRNDIDDYAYDWSLNDSR